MRLSRPGTRLDWNGGMTPAPRTRRGRLTMARRLIVGLVGLVATGGGVSAQARAPVNANPSGTITDSGADVTLRPGDALRVTVWRKPELSGEFAIAGNGTIVHPLYREIRVTGIPIAAVEERLREFIGRLEANPQFVMEPLLRVSVEGEVRQPSVYNLRPETSIAQAIALAGGPTERGRSDRVRLIRANGDADVDLRRADVGGSVQTIRSGDRIIVERSRAVFRDVVTPAISILGATAAIVSVFLYQGNR
jgi:polysaccharide biosynthesis/export protein